MVSRQTQKSCTTFIQRRPNDFDVGLTLYKCYTIVLWEAGKVAGRRGIITLCLYGANPRAARAVYIRF